MTRELLSEIGYEDTVVLDPPFLDKAINGITHDGRAIYDYDKLVKAYMDGEKWTEEEAIEWIEYNTIRSLPYTPNSPIIMYNLTEYENIENDM